MKVPVSIQNWLYEFARLMKRSPEELRRVGSVADVRSKMGTALTLLIPVVGVFVAYLAWEARRWDDIKPSVVLTTSDWRTLYRDPNVLCPADAQNAKGCFASPGTPDLWQSSTRRSDLSHVERMRERRNQTVWIGIKISAEKLRRAASEEATHLILGYLGGRFRIWVDGQEIVSSDFKDTRFPIAFPISKNRFVENRDLYIAIEILNNAGLVYPDFLGGDLDIGLTRFHRANDQTSLYLFRNQLRGWVFFVLNAFVGVIFLYLWSSAKKKQEYFYFGLFAFNQAAVQLFSIDGVRRFTGMDWYYDSMLFTSWYGAALALALGLSFSRSRLDFLRLGLPVAFFVPIVSLLPIAGFDSVLKAGLWMLIGQRTIPTAFLMSSVLCVIQAFSVLKENGSTYFARIRINRLLTFAGLLFMIAGLYAIESSLVLPANKFATWFYVAHFALVLFLGLVVGEDYREDQKTIQTTPISKFHLHGSALVRGAVLSIDLKSSGIYYRQRAESGTDLNLVTRWRSHMYLVIQKFGGTVISKKGDEVTAIFESGAGSGGVVQALNTMKACSEESALLWLQLKEEQLLPGESEGLYFRGAISVGALKPTMEVIDGRRYPEWEEAEHTSPFVEISRLLEAEKSMALPRSASRVVISNGSLQLLSAVVQAKDFQESFVTTKDDKRIRIGVMELNGGAEYRTYAA